MSTSAVLPPLPQLDRDYVCPGQRDGITETVHSARLAAGDPRCAGCEHNPERPTATSELTHDHGHLRGRHLRGLDAATLGDTLARWAGEVTRHGRARVVVGRDRRYASADLSPAFDRLAMFDIERFDVGCVHRPVFDNAILGLNADVGLFLTAGTRPAGWGGIDVLGPVANTEQLPEPERGTVVRTRRVATPTRTVDAHTLDELAFASMLANLRSTNGRCNTPPSRPLSVAVHCTDRSVTDRIDWQLAQLGAVVSAASARRPFDLAARVAQDGQTCELYDERGRAIPPHTVSRYIANCWEAACGVRPFDLTADARCELVTANHATDEHLETLLYVALRTADADVGIASSGTRHLLWNGRRFVRDASLVLTLTVARLMHADCPASLDTL